MVSLRSVMDYLKFGISYWYISVISTVGLLAYSYWDIIQLRYISGFFGLTELSGQSQDLFIVSFGNNLSNNFSEFLPVLVASILAIVVAYTLYETYADTLHKIDVNHNYKNVKKVKTLNISLHYAVLYSTAFVIPLFFWCFYLINWFPLLAKFPLSYIFSSSPLKFALVLSSVLLCMILLTQVGLILTRFSVRLFKIN